MKNPELKAVKFDNKDVIATSGDLVSTQNVVTFVDAFDLNSHETFRNHLIVNEQTVDDFLAKKEGNYSEELISQVESNKGNDSLFTQEYDMPGDINEIDSDSEEYALRNFVSGMYADNENTDTVSKLSEDKVNINKIYNQIKYAKFVYNDDIDDLETDVRVNPGTDNSLWIDRNGNGRYEDAWYDTEGDGVYNPESDPVRVGDQWYIDYSGNGHFEETTDYDVDDDDPKLHGDDELLTLSDVIRSTTGTRAQINITKEMERRLLDEDEYDNIDISSMEDEDKSLYYDGETLEISEELSGGDLKARIDNELDRTIYSNIKVVEDEYTLSNVEKGGNNTSYELQYSKEGDESQQLTYDLSPRFFGGGDVTVQEELKYKNTNPDILGTQGKQVWSLADLFSKTVWHYNADTNTFMNDSRFKSDVSGNIS